MRTANAVPNKPMVPTAPATLTEYPSASLRRHIGQPLGSGEEQRASEEQDAGRRRQVKSVSQQAETQTRIF